MVILAATFGWLCVETFCVSLQINGLLAATFGWLCVETDEQKGMLKALAGSHLRVAVC